MMRDPEFMRECLDSAFVAMGRVLPSRSNMESDEAYPKSMKQARDQ